MVTPRVCRIKKKIIYCRLCGKVALLLTDSVHLLAFWRLKNTRFQVGFCLIDYMKRVTLQLCIILGRCEKVYQKFSFSALTQCSVESFDIGTDMSEQIVQTLIRISSNLYCVPLNSIALRKAKIPLSFGISQCKRVKEQLKVNECTDNGSNSVISIFAFLLNWGQTERKEFSPLGPNSFLLSRPHFRKVSSSSREEIGGSALFSFKQTVEIINVN